MATNAEELQLESLLMPPKFLQKLTLIGQLNRLHPWTGSLAHLTHLYLGYSCLQEDILSPLHVLPSLVLLELKQGYNGMLLHFKAEWFHRLNKLNFIALPQLHNMELDEGSLPSIQELCLVQCQAMQALPHGIEHLTSLKKLQLEEMPKQLVQRLRNGTSEDQQKVTHIPTIELVYVTAQTRVVETL